MVSALDSGSSGPGSSPAGDINSVFCVVFSGTGDTYSYSAFTQVYKWLLTNLILGVILGRVVRKLVNANV